MKSSFTQTFIDGVIEISVTPFADNRGIFSNLYRSTDDTYMNSWSDRNISQVNYSRTDLVGSIRGIHFQAHPYSEAKLVRCLNGRVWDVAVDLRIDSSTYLHWYGCELSPDFGNAILIPEGCGHAFQTLEPSSELLYLHSGNWVPNSEKGIRWDDPSLSISWPLPPSNISYRDSHFPYLAST